jgi:hypothetical protein
LWNRDAASTEPLLEASSDILAGALPARSFLHVFYAQGFCARQAERVTKRIRRSASRGIRAAGGGRRRRTKWHESARRASAVELRI